MPVWDTEENKRTKYTKVSLNKLMDSITGNDTVIVSDNNSCDETLEIYEDLKNRYVNFNVIYNKSNLGIAAAVNLAWRNAKPDEVLCKIDNDCVINTPNWIEKVEFVLNRQPDIGILGMKRKDVAEHPNSEIQWYRSKLLMVDHNPGEPWYVVEEVQHVMGTCYCFNPSMLPKFGYLQQPGTVYGFDDSIAAVRAHALGFKTCFLHGVDIDHIDTGDAESFAKWKQHQAAIGMSEYNRIREMVSNGSLSPYYNGGFND